MGGMVCYNISMKNTIRKTRAAIENLALAAQSLPAAMQDLNGELPPPGEAVQALGDKLLAAMPEVSPSKPQRAALACIIDGRDELRMARTMGLSLRQARQLTAETLGLLGFESRAKLLLRLGGLCAAPEGDPLEQYGLTGREREICTLLLTTGGAQKHIAGQLGLSADTVKFHVKNIYRKLGVQSRAELEAKFHCEENKP